MNFLFYGLLHTLNQLNRNRSVLQFLKLKNEFITMKSTIIKSIMVIFSSKNIANDWTFHISYSIDSYNPWGFQPIFSAYQFQRIAVWVTSIE